MDRSERNQRNLRGDIVFVFVLAAVGYVCWLARDVLVLLYVSALFAVVVSPIVRFVGQVRVGRWQPFHGFAIFYLLIAALAAIVGFGFLAIPPVVRDLQTFGGEMPSRIPNLFMRAVNLPFLGELRTAGIGAKIQDMMSTAATQVLLAAKNSAGVLLRIVTGIILTIYFILDGKLAYKWFLSFFPVERRGRLDLALQRANIRMGKWLLGQGSLMLILGIASTLVYVSLHVRYPYALGVLTGMLNLIPLLGAVISIGIAVVVAAVDSWGRVLGVGIFFLAYIWIENWFLTPRIMRNSVDLPSIAILTALLLGFELDGVPGAMVAIPTAVLVAVLVDEYLVQKE